MISFNYEALNPQGEEQSGQIEADTQDDAKRLLREQGLFATRVWQEKHPEEEGDDTVELDLFVRATLFTELCQSTLEKAWKEAGEKFPSNETPDRQVKKALSEGQLIKTTQGYFSVIKSLSKPLVSGELRTPHPYSFFLVQERGEFYLFIKGAACQCFAVKLKGGEEKLKAKLLQKAQES